MELAACISSTYLISYPPEMPSGIWSFNPANGFRKVIGGALTWPNGLHCHSDNSTLYVSNTQLTLNRSTTPSQRLSIVEKDQPQGCIRLRI